MTDAPKKPELSKADRFKQDAPPRVDKALDAIANLRSLANAKRYEYAPEQLAKIESALTGEVSRTVASFKTVEKPSFNF